MKYFSLRIYLQGLYEIKVRVILCLDPPNPTHSMKSFKLPIPILLLGTTSPKNITLRTDG